MSLTIRCLKCDTKTGVATVLELLQEHTNGMGRFTCAQCDGTDTVLQPPRRQQSGSAQRWIRGILEIATPKPQVDAPFVFLSADAPDGDVTGIEFKYYRVPGSARDDAPHPNGGLVLGPDQVLALAKDLARIGVVPPARLEQPVQEPRSRRAAR